MKYLQTFEEFLNESQLNEEESVLNKEQKYLYDLMEYIIMNYDEYDFDDLQEKIAKKIKSPNWAFAELSGDNLLKAKEILKKYYEKEKLISDKFLKNPAKKWQGFIAAYKWLTE